MDLFFFGKALSPQFGLVCPAFMSKKGDKPDYTGPYPGQAAKNSQDVGVFYSGGDKKQSGNNKTDQARYLRMFFLHFSAWFIYKVSGG